MIMCLGWGSLIWDPGQLAVSGGWQEQGPEVPVEYLRQSRNGRLTLVIEPSAPKVRALWAKMQISNLDEAIENLRQREGGIKREFVGFWEQGNHCPEEIPRMADWAKAVGATAVIWTALPARFNGEDYRKPDIGEAITYLEKMGPETRALAEEYIRKTPPQISTVYRSRFEQHFGWVKKRAT